MDEEPLTLFGGPDAGGTGAGGPYDVGAHDVGPGIDGPETGGPDAGGTGAGGPYDVGAHDVGPGIDGPVTGGPETGGPGAGGAVAGGPGGRVEPAPGAVHVPGWLPMDQQRRLVEACRRWATGPVPMRHTRLPRGGVMSVRTVCVGWHWQPYRYTRTAGDVNGARVALFPEWLARLGRRAVADAYRDPAAGEAYQPDTALINFYDAQARMGMHQDKDERSRAPVVSLSIGDSCVFRFGNTETRARPYTDVVLRSGDLFVFGGPSRLAYHGVPRIHPGTADPATGLSGGRLNITLRVTGLPG